MTEDAIKQWGICKVCSNYINLNEEGICRTCVLYPTSNVGKKQEEWRISKLKKKEDKDE